MQFSEMRWIDAVVQWLRHRSVKCDFGVKAKVPGSIPGKGSPMVVQKIHRHGAEAARGAHNSEVTRSKRVAGIFPIRPIYRSGQGDTCPLKPLPLRCGVAGGVRRPW